MGEMEPDLELVPLLLTRVQAAKVLAMSVRKLDSHIARGDIVPIRDGRWVRIPKTEVERFTLNLQRRAHHLPPVPAHVGTVTS